MPFSKILQNAIYGQLTSARPPIIRPFTTQTASQVRHSSSHRRVQVRIPASYYRGGTSRAVIFQRKHLPQDRTQWDPIFRSIIGSPDPEHGRQLDGLGAGLSSLSKVCVISPSDDPEADVDYTFVAVGVRDSEVDYSSNCGNMSSAVGPFAVDAGLLSVKANQPDVTVRIKNTNTGKYINSSFPTDEEGKASSYGEFGIDGVSGTGAKIKLTFLDPSGSKTGKLLPTGNTIDKFDEIETTCIDVGNPCVFVAASALGVSRDASPDDIAADANLLQRLDLIRRLAGARMGLAASPERVPGSIPKIAIVSPAGKGPDGKTLESDIIVRAISVGQPHKAVPITVAMALAAATRVPHSTAHSARESSEGTSPDKDGITIAHPTGRILVSSTLDENTGSIEDASVFRTARLLMSGEAHVK